MPGAAGNPFRWFFVWSALSLVLRPAAIGAAHFLDIAFEASAEAGAISGGHFPIAQSGRLLGNTTMDPIPDGGAKKCATSLFALLPANAGIFPIEGPANSVMIAQEAHRKIRGLYCVIRPRPRFGMRADRRNAPGVTFACAPRHIGY